MIDDEDTDLSVGRTYIDHVVPIMNYAAPVGLPSVVLTTYFLKFCSRRFARVALNSVA